MDLYFINKNTSHSISVIKVNITHLNYILFNETLMLVNNSSRVLLMINIYSNSVVATYIISDIYEIKKSSEVYKYENKWFNFIHVIRVCSKWIILIPLLLLMSSILTLFYTLTEMSIRWIQFRNGKRGNLTTLKLTKILFSKLNQYLQIF